MVTKNPLPLSIDRHLFISAWAHIRAGLVLLHLLAIAIMAFPAPGEGMVREAWKDPTAQEEFAAWTGRLNDWGIAVTQTEFEERLWQVAETYMAVWQGAQRPFKPYYSLCGTTQSWRMFAGPHRYPTRLHIDIEEAGRWRPAYVQRDPRHDWLHALLDHYRFRPLIYRFGWYQHVAGYADYQQFADWVASQARADFPEAERVRVYFFKSRTPSPEETRQGVSPPSEMVGEVVRDLRSSAGY